MGYLILGNHYISRCIILSYHVSDMHQTNIELLSVSSVRWIILKPRMANHFGQTLGFLKSQRLTPNWIASVAIPNSYNSLEMFESCCNLCPGDLKQIFWDTYFHALPIHPDFFQPHFSKNVKLWDAPMCSYSISASWITRIFDTQILHPPEGPEKCQQPPRCLLFFWLTHQLLVNMCDNLKVQPANEFIMVGNGLSWLNIYI